MLLTAASGEFTSLNGLPKTVTCLILTTTRQLEAVFGNEAQRSAVTGYRIWRQVFTRKKRKHTWQHRPLQAGHAASDRIGMP